MINEEELMGLLIKDKRIGRTGFGAIVEDIEQLKELGYELGKSVSNSWIPCSERLPEQIEKVLVVTDKGCYYIAMLNTKNEWVCIAEMINTQITYSKVVAWMPLPTPYQPEDTE